MFEEQQEQTRVYQVTEGLKSKHTIKTYGVSFNHFLEFCESSDNALLDLKPSVVESKIIDYISHLKEDSELTYRSILVHLAAIFHFFELNDYNLNNRKIKRFLPEDESEYYAKDRPYSIQEITQILSKCDVRSRVAVLIMASAGLRIGGLRELQIGDIRKIDEFGLYMIWVYNRSGKYRYYTFCTPECSTAIDEWLSYRTKHGEQLKDKSPLIRDKCRADSYFRAPKFLSIRAMSLMFEGVLKRAKEVDPKGEVSRTHGYRKWFITQCDRSGMSFTTREYLSGHKLPNQDASYIRTTEEDRLAEYVKVIDILTIDPTKRLKQENQELKKDYLAELGDLRYEFNEMKRLLIHLEKGTQKKLVEEFSQKTSEELQEEVWKQEQGDDNKG